MAEIEWWRKDFDNEFKTDEEVEEMLDSIITTVGRAFEEVDKKTAIINPLKIRQVLYTYKVLKYLTRGEKNVQVTYELHEPYKHMGSVSIVGKHLKFSRPEWFIKAAELASNLDIFPKTDGTVQMDFTFHGLTMPMDN